MTDRTLKTGITGAHGWLGWHLRCFLHGHEDIEALPANRETFSDSNRLEQFVNDCDVIVHLAGMNRGDEKEVERVNLELGQQLVSALKKSKSKAHVLFANSTHVDRDTGYGRSKKATAEALSQWAKQSGGRFTNFILPHLFGELGKPFYNSVTATFCHQLANGESPEVHQDAELELVHAQDVGTAMLDAVLNQKEGDIRVAGEKIAVSALLEKIKTLADTYSRNLIPDVRDAFTLKLFNTYRSYLYPSHYPVTLKLHADPRGELFEAVKEVNGGQTYLSFTRPGATRGNHFHLSKVERFLVVQGEAVIKIRKMFDDEVREFHVNGNPPQFIDIPTLHTHNIINQGKSDVLTLFWSNEIFDPDRPDTIREEV